MEQIAHCFRCVGNQPGKLAPTGPNHLRKCPGILNTLESLGELFLRVPLARTLIQHICSRWGTHRACGSHRAPARPPALRLRVGSWVSWLLSCAAPSPRPPSASLSVASLGGWPPLMRRPLQELGGSGCETPDGKQCREVLCVLLPQEGRWGRAEGLAQPSCSGDPSELQMR